MTTVFLLTDHGDRKKSIFRGSPFEMIFRRKVICSAVLVVTSLLASSCSPSGSVERPSIPTPKASSVASRLVRIESEFIGHKVPAINRRNQALIELFNSAGIKGPGELKCSLPNTRFLKIECIDQRFYPGLGEGKVLRILITHDGGWPGLLTFQVGGQTVYTTVHDRDDFLIRIYTTPLRAGRSEIGSHWVPENVIWVIKQRYVAPVVGKYKNSGPIWETWIRTANSTWGYIAGEDVSRNDEGLFKKHLIQLSGKAMRPDLYELH